LLWCKVQHAARAEGAGILLSCLRFDKTVYMLMQIPLHTGAVQLRLHLEECG